MREPNGAATGHSQDRVEELSASQVVVERSAVRSLQADHASFDRSVVGSARVQYGTIRQSNSGIVVGRSLACDQVRAGILVSPVVRGEVHTWLDLRTAVAIGFGMALGQALIAMLRALGRRAFR